MKYSARLVVAAFVAVTLAVPSGSQAQPVAAVSQPPRATQPMPDIRTPDQVDISGYSPADLAWMAEHYGTDIEGARQRARIETAAMGGFQRRVRDRWPDSFGGVWITQGPDARVVVAFAEPGLDLVSRHRAVGELFAYPQSIDIGLVERPLVQLETLADQLMTDRTEAASGRGRRHPDIDRHRGRYDIAVDQVANTVEVRISDAPGSPGFQRSARAFRESYRAPWLAVESGIVQPNRCYRENCQWTMRGGLTLRWNDLYCTSAFSAWRNISGRYQYYITSAAHCPGGTRRNGPNGHYGSVDRQVQSGAVDAERIPYTYTDKPWTNSGRFLVDNNTEETRGLTQHLYHPNIPIGMTVGMSGAYSNLQRGVVERNDIRPSYVTNARNFFQASYCSWEGDSGGPVFNSTRAVGIHSGHIHPPNYSTGYCDAVFGAAGEARDALGVEYLAG